MAIESQYLFGGWGMRSAGTSGRLAIDREGLKCYTFSITVACSSVVDLFASQGLCEFNQFVFIQNGNRNNQTID